MGDIPEELLAEEEEMSVGIMDTVNGAVAGILGLVSSYGWYLVAIGAGGYYIWKNYGDKVMVKASTLKPLSEKDAKQFEAKEEARQRFVAKMQQQYEADAVARAEKQKQMDEEKRKQRLAELEKLALQGGKQLGSSSNQTTFRPEYNPLMGDSSLNRVCNRSSGGRSGG